MDHTLQVLIVDDDSVDRRICRRALAQLDPAPVFVEAETAAEAERYLAGHDVDCVLLDYGLPDMNGLELLVRLAARDVEQRVPVVMLTGADDVSVAVEAMRSGASDYVVKDTEGRYQALMPTIVHHALRDRELELARWRNEQALEGYRRDLSSLTRRLMITEKTTTHRLAQMLHDQLGQTLAAVRLGFDAVFAACGANVAPQAQQRALRVSALIDQAVREVREVLVELRPPLLHEQGLVAALDNELRIHPLVCDDVELRLDPDGCGRMRWPADVEYSAFMIAREAIANALRHARPRSVLVRLRGGDGALRMRIADDGSGVVRDASRSGHLGIVGMRERALAIGAHFAIESAPGCGTTVVLDWSRSS